MEAAVPAGAPQMRSCASRHRWKAAQPNSIGETTSLGLLARVACARKKPRLEAKKPPAAWRQHAGASSDERMSVTSLAQERHSGEG